MNKIILPAGPEPKKLTAKSPLRTLLEHQLAFINANNKKGFLETDYLDEDQVSSIAAQLLSISKQPMVKIADIQKIAQDSMYTIKNSAGHDEGRQAIGKKAIAKLLGYKDYATLVYYARADRTVVNRNNEATARNELFSNKKVKKSPLVKKPSKDKLVKQLKEYNFSRTAVYKSQEWHDYVSLEKILVDLFTYKDFENFEIPRSGAINAKCYFDKNTEFFKEHASEELKALVDRAWSALNEYLVLRDPITKEPKLINRRCTDFYFGNIILHNHQTPAPNLKVTVTYKDMRFIFVAS